MTDKTKMQGLAEWLRLIGDSFILNGGYQGGAEVADMRRWASEVDAALAQPAPLTVSVDVLRQHWLRALECDHETRQDKPHCACSRLDLGWHPSIGAAVEAWLTHVQQAQPASDPLDTPLPCDITVGHGTMRKGVKLRTLVARMKVLYEMATGHNAAQPASGRISGGAPSGTPTCPTCPHLLKDKGYPGWGWCDAPPNRIAKGGWVNGFTPSQSPTGTCALHPDRAAPDALTAAARKALEALEDAGRTFEAIVNGTRGGDIHAIGSATAKARASIADLRKALEGKAP